MARALERRSEQPPAGLNGFFGWVDFLVIFIVVAIVGDNTAAITAAVHIAAAAVTSLLLRGSDL